MFHKTSEKVYAPLEVCMCAARMLATFVDALKLRLLEMRSVGATTLEDAQLVAAACEGCAALAPPDTDSTGNCNLGRHGVAT